MRRLISHSEISMALDCQARHAFAYTGHLTAGDTLQPHAPAARLRAGRAWGRAVATFHGADENLTIGFRYGLALIALDESLDQDAAQMRAHGFYDEAEHHDMAVRLADILWHYVVETEPLKISDPEFQLLLPLPSRSGRGVSNRYSFHGYVDGLAVLDDRLWIVEYKLRDQLSDLEQVTRMRQYRRYAWAVERQLNVAIAGVLVDERLSVAPKPVVWVKAKRKGEGINGRVPSTKKDALTIAPLYIEACLEAGVDIDQATVDALNARHWQKRHRVIFRRSEIEEAGRELVSAAHQIQMLDSGVVFPVRNPSPRLCGGCQFKEICVRPDDRELIEVNFEIAVPKRDRALPLEAATS